jgi:hypothetical protein
MVQWLLEIICVLAFSRRAQWALALGLVGFVSIMLIGHHMTDSFELSGAMAPLSEVFRAKIAHRYDKAAYACLFSFWALAFKFYRKDKKRVFGFY